MSYYGKAYGAREQRDAANTGKRKGGWNPNWKKGPPVVRGSEYKPIAAPSAQQVAIFEHCRNSSKSLVIKAYAGTGKTATVVEVMNKYLPKGNTIAYFIFANRNAREAESKCHQGIEVRTCHAFGLSILKAAFGLKSDCVDASGEKSRNIAQALLGPEEEKTELRYNFCKAMSLAKAYLCESVESVVEVCDKHEVELCGMSEEDFGAKVLEGLTISAKQYARVEFDDMIWLPIKLGLRIPTFDYVVADECQDLNPARRTLILAAIGKKIIAVGDDNQAIFGFTGADNESINKIIEATGADVLPLSTTYRCGRAIVALAAQLVPDYTAWEGNPEGVVEDKSESDVIAEGRNGGAVPGDFILSRTNAPLVGLCLQFVKMGVRASVQGKDLGKNLTYMIKRSGAHNVDAFLTWLDEWQNIECERLVKKNKPCDHIVDKADCLRVFCEGVRDLDGVRARIETMFSDEEPGKPDTATIRLSTVHKAKGLERDRVWVLQHTFRCVGPDENNVWYVALTRARSHLFLVGGKPSKKGGETGGGRALDGISHDAFDNGSRENGDKYDNDAEGEIQEIEGGQE